MKAFLRILVIVVILAVALYFPLSAILRVSSANAEPAQVEDEEREEVLGVHDPDSTLSRTEYTPDTYVPPKYDPFTDEAGTLDPDFEEKVEQAGRDSNTPPKAAFRVDTVEKGLADDNSGTLNTTFKFSASGVRDNESRTSDLQVRWDFNGDGKWDSFFSESKNKLYKYERPGEYNVVMEVLDEGGLKDKIAHTVKVVENEGPRAVFVADKKVGATGAVITFNTSESGHNQFEERVLEYRFDWDGDGYYDTPYNGKSVWRHVWDEPGLYTVLLEVKDPEEKVAQSELQILIGENKAPIADFAYSADEGRSGDIVYRFDAADSFDPEGGKLKYRWDFNYQGENDINFTTNWSTSRKHSGHYENPGNKVVRLQVMDEQGLVGEKFIGVEVV